MNSTSMGYDSPQQKIGSVIPKRTDPKGVSLAATGLDRWITGIERSFFHSILSSFLPVLFPVLLPVFLSSCFSFLTLFLVILSLHRQR